MQFAPAVRLLVEWERQELALLMLERRDAEPANDKETRGEQT
jgi:hypothetical protein